MPKRNGQPTARRRCRQRSAMRRSRAIEPCRPTPTRRLPAAPPAHLLGSGQTYGAPTVLARAHHGSVSKEQRAIVEEDLKSGRPEGGRCDPRAWNWASTWARWTWLFRWKHHRRWPADCNASGRARTPGRRDLPGGALSQTPDRLDRMRGDGTAHAHRPDRDDARADEPARHPGPAHPWPRPRWSHWTSTAGSTTVRRSAPFATLPHSAFEATLDLLSGKYPSTEFAELRPRLVYDRDNGTGDGAARRAAPRGDLRWRHPRTAACSPSTWPPTPKPPSRVGELDEEMVYESRPGDVIRAGCHQLANHRDHP